MTIRGTLYLLTIVLLTACSPPHPTSVVDPTPTDDGPYVALGDSYTAAPSVPTQTGTPAGCERSSSNYPSLVAAPMHPNATGEQGMADAVEHAVLSSP